MLSGTANISRGLPAISVLHLAGDRRLNVKSPTEITSDEVVLTAVENPPRTCETRPLAALIPDVLARYGLDTATAPFADAAPMAKQPAIDPGTSIDVSV